MLRSVLLNNAEALEGVVRLISPGACKMSSRRSTRIISAAATFICKSTMAAVFAGLLAALVVPSNAAPARTFDADVIRDWQTSKLFTLAVAEAMPADKFGFRVTPEVRSFAELMIHIATSQAERFAQMSGNPAPFSVEENSQKLDKADILRLLNQSFDYCIAKLNSFTPVQLQKNYEVDWYERPEVSGREMVTAMFVHTAHHRAQAEVYLRANGIAPPTYRF